MKPSQVTGGEWLQTDRHPSCLLLLQYRYLLICAPNLNWVLVRPIQSFFFYPLLPLPTSFSIPVFLLPTTPCIIIWFIHGHISWKKWEIFFKKCTMFMGGFSFQLKIVLGQTLHIFILTLPCMSSTWEFQFSYDPWSRATPILVKDYSIVFWVPC